MFCENCGQGSLGSFCPYCGTPDVHRVLGQDVGFFCSLKSSLDPASVFKSMTSVDVSSLPKVPPTRAFTPPAALSGSSFDVLGAAKWLLYGVLALGAGFAGMKGYEAIAGK